MLPFLKNQKRQVAGVITEVRHPDGAEDQPEDMHDEQGLDAAAADLIKAIEAKDIKSVSKALKAAHAILDSSDEEMIEDKMSELGE